MDVRPGDMASGPGAASSPRVGQVGGVGGTHGCGGHSARRASLRRETVHHTQATKGAFPSLSHAFKSARRSYSCSLQDDGAGPRMPPVPPPSTRTACNSWPSLLLLDTFGDKTRV